MEIKFEAIGTVWEIEFEFSRKSNIYIDENTLKIREIINDFENKYSRFQKTSLIFKLRDCVGTFEVGKEFIEILKFYYDFYKATNKQFTPLIGQNLEESGYDKTYSFQN
jgi:hypothetical protein